MKVELPEWELGFSLLLSRRLFCFGCFLQRICICILGNPGAVSGGGKKSNRKRKNSGEEKSRTRPWVSEDDVFGDESLN